MIKYLRTMYFDFLTLVLPLLVVVTVALQVIATKKALRDTGFEPEQRHAQMWLIWLVPIFGASMVLAVLDDKPPQHPKTMTQDSNQTNT